VKTIQSHIDDALSKGAISATPRNESFLSVPSQKPEGNYIAPTVLTNVTHDMTVMKDETFGPVLPIMKVSSDEEAIALMNDSEYGLTASVWTRDVARGEELIAEIEAGTVFINRCDYPSPVCTSSLLLSEDPRVGSANEAIGSCVGWVEELRVGMYAGAACV
jgi:acyl-CoA reductase-like NAD-dependent aldehyde dehydrogenase